MTPYICPKKLWNLQGREIFEKECEGMVKLEALEYHNNESIRTGANHILEMYYGEQVGEVFRNFEDVWTAGNCWL